LISARTFLFRLFRRVLLFLRIFLLRASLDSVHRDLDFHLRDIFQEEERSFFRDHVCQTIRLPELLASTHRIYSVLDPSFLPSQEIFPVRANFLPVQHFLVDLVHDRDLPAYRLFHLFPAFPVPTLGFFHHRDQSHRKVFC
jgi:hypothetical protein